jgi:ABC-type multidrug transport system ATPase subunit
MTTTETDAALPAFVPVADSPVTVGRSAGSALRLTDPSVSRAHATLRRAGGRIVVEDHDSRFGTFVNGARVRTAAVAPGDRVRFGAAAAYRVEPGGLRLDPAAGVALEVDGLTLAVDATADPARALGALLWRRGGPGPGGDDARRVLVRDVSFCVRPDAFVGLLGPSGAGKSTVLRCLAGLRPPAEGRLTFDGGRDAYAEPEAYWATLGHVPQDDVVDARLTVRENLALAARLRLGRGADVAAAVGEAAERVGLGGCAGTAAGTLSGGQRKRLGVAVELLRRPRLLMLDEPAAGLDPASEARLMELLRLVARRGATVVCTTHLTDHLRLLDEVLVIGVKDGVGRVAYAGPPEGLLPHFGCRHYADLYEALDGGRFDPAGEGAAEGLPVIVPLAVDGAPLGTPPTDSCPAPVPVRQATEPLAAPAAAGDFLGQFAVVAGRLALLLARDRGLAAATAAQPVALGLLVALTQYGIADNEVGKVTFFAVVVAIWLGLNGAARDLVRDRRHYVRDRLAGLRPGAYLGALAAVHAAVGAGQVAALLAVLRLVGGWVLAPEAAAALRAAAGAPLAATLLLSHLGGVGLGLLASARARTEEAAVAALPLLIMPQLLLSAVATGVYSTPHADPRPFRPLAVALTAGGAAPSWPAALVDAASLACLSRPAALVAEAPRVAGYGPWAWLGDLCHLLILLFGVWALVLLAFGRAERRWLRSEGLG